MKGRVVRGAEPVKGGLIFFSPADDSNITCQGEIQEDGTFTLVTNMSKPAKQNVPGAPEGAYQVFVRLKSEQADAPSIPLAETQTIKPGDNNITIDLAAGKKR